MPRENACLTNAGRTAHNAAMSQSSNDPRSQYGTTPSTDDPNAYWSADGRGDRREKPPASGCKSVAIGCGCVFAVVLLLLGAAGVYLAFHWREYAASLAKATARAAVTESGLSQEDQGRLLTRIDQIADDFVAGKISQEQITRIAAEIMNSPVLPMGVVIAADQSYVAPSGLSEEEKEAARRTLQRFARGAFEKTISESDVQEVLEMMTESQGNTHKVREHLTDDELRRILEVAKGKADAVEVPDEPYEIDVVGEIEAAISRALNETAEQPEFEPATAPAQ